MYVGARLGVALRLDGNQAEAKRIEATEAEPATGQVEIEKAYALFKIGS